MKLNRIKELRENHLLKSIERSSYDQLLEKFGLDQLVNFADNENIYGPPSIVYDDLRGQIEELSSYPDPESRLLTEKLSALHGIDREEIVVGNGVMDIIRLVFTCCADSNRSALFSKGSFVQFKAASAIFGVKFRESSLQKNQVCLDSMLENITDDTQLILLSNPNNPTGTLLSLNEIEKFLLSVPSDVFVVVDEAYLEYSDDYPSNSTVKLRSKFQNLIVLKTFSKAYGLPGARIGYAVLDRELADCCRKVSVPFSVSRLGQIAATRAIDEASHIHDIRRKNSVERDWLQAQLESLGLVVEPSQANFLFVDLGNRLSVELYTGLLKRGALVKPLAIYDFKNHHRVTVLDRARNQFLVDCYRQELQDT